MLVVSAINTPWFSLKKIVLIKVCDKKRASVKVFEQKLVSVTFE